ncbi:putative methyltransferase-domain-containing protein [Baffinella frigidus]|nr:putative methyltransferase-domain-containing protein [Cryptophyta sp. CCMP2293]
MAVTNTPASMGTAESITGTSSLKNFGVYDAKLNMWRRELPVSGKQAPLVVYEDPNKATDQGDHFIWPSSLALANLLNRAPETVCGKRVIELGASHGLVSMTAAALNAAEVVATDQASVMQYLQANIDRNPHVSVRAEVLQWGQEVPHQAPSPLSGEWDVILGSDLTFHKASFLPLLHTLSSLASPSTHVILMHDDDSVPGGHRLRKSFFHDVAPTYFSVEELSAASTLDASFSDPTIHIYSLRLLQSAPSIILASPPTVLAPSVKLSPGREEVGTLADMLAHFSQPASSPAQQVNPKPSTLNPQTRNSNSEKPHLGSIPRCARSPGKPFPPKPETLHPTPKPLNPTPQPLNPTPQPLNPKPKTQNSKP